jgi:hypothetical protein
VEVEESNSGGRMLFIFKKERSRFQVGRERWKEGRNDDEMNEAKPTPHQGFNYIARITRPTSHPAIT